MTDRKTLDQMTSDDLDHLHRQLDAARRALNPDDLRLVDEMTATVEQHMDQAARAEAAVARVRKAIDSVKAAGQGHTPTTPYDRGVERAVDWVTMRVLEAIDARLVNGTAPEPAATQATERSDTGTGLVVHPYRDERNLQRWVFRCWGTDTCDGWLGLGHHTEASALREWDRHVAEAHTEPAPATATEPCAGFPDACPNPVNVPALSPYHGGGIRCGCTTPKES
ncbi:MAG: hypothetical protein HOV92_00555 [Streptomyces sp.]|nr:hypothetical protein [Streptomyces sp.]